MNARDSDSLTAKVMSETITILVDWVMWLDMLDRTWPATTVLRMTPPCADSMFKTLGTLAP